MMILPHRPPHPRLPGDRPPGHTDHADSQHAAQILEPGASPNLALLDNLRERILRLVLLLLLLLMLRLLRRRQRPAGRGAPLGELVAEAAAQQRGGRQGGIGR